jgi:hypothetical protein
LTSRQHFQPPRNFHPAGEVAKVEIAHSPPSFARSPKRLTGAKGAGLRYERKAQATLQECYGARYTPSPWLRFLAFGKWRWCQPDGLLLDAEHGRLVVVEIKLQHCLGAWYQLEHLYVPVVRSAFPDYHLATCEVVRWFDPATAFPTKPTLVERIEWARPDAFAVHILKP